ncbi:hypothetical protein TKK_0011715 [Trichogramma kaykai]|uniref:G-patch domain-containing protein n=1 Tax=Trichogramma kaykai TaxID=54128 RepID=A0ABD2WQ09_9HYME
MANFALRTDPPKGANQSKKKKKPSWFYVKSLLCGVDRCDLKPKKLQKEDKSKTKNYKSTDCLIKSENYKVKPSENSKTNNRRGSDVLLKSENSKVKSSENLKTKNNRSTDGLIKSQNLKVKSSENYKSPEGLIKSVSSKVKSSENSKTKNNRSTDGLIKSENLKVKFGENSKTKNYKSTCGLIKSENSKVKSGENIQNCVSAADDRKKVNKVYDVKISNCCEVEKKCFQSSSKNKKANNSSATKVLDRDNNNKNNYSYDQKTKISKNSHGQRKNKKSSHLKDHEKSPLKTDDKKNVKNSSKPIDSVISKNDSNENKKARRKKNKRKNASTSDKVTSENNNNVSPKKVQQKVVTLKKKLIVDEYEKLLLEKIILENKSKRFVKYDLRCPIGSRISFYHEDDKDCPQMIRSKRKGKKLELMNKPCVFVRPSMDSNNNETVDTDKENSEKEDSNDGAINDSVKVDVSSEISSSESTEIIYAVIDTSNKTEVNNFGEDSSIKKKKTELEKKLEYDAEAWKDFRIGVGAKILLQLGWIPGKGLGKNLQGILFPVEVTKRRRRKAL